MDNAKSEIMLLRMEARRIALEEDDERTLDWSIEVDTNNEDVVLLTGHLFRVGSFGIGQALAMLVVKDNLSYSERLSPEACVDWAENQGWLEALYDSCRRSITVQSSLMDFDPELPVKAPDFTTSITEYEEQ